MAHTIGTKILKSDYAETADKINSFFCKSLGMTQQLNLSGCLTKLTIRTALYPK